jgi:hypothetical protein
MANYPQKQLFGSAVTVISTATDNAAGNFSGAPAATFTNNDAAVPGARWAVAMGEFPDWAAAPVAGTVIELWGLIKDVDSTDDDTDAPSGTASGGARLFGAFVIAAADALQRRTITIDLLGISEAMSIRGDVDRLLHQERHRAEHEQRRRHERGRQNYSVRRGGGHLAMASLKFNNANTDRVEIGSGALLDNLNAGAALMWVWIDSYVTTRRFFAKGSGETTAGTSHNLLFLDNGGNPSLRLNIARATITMQSQALLTTFAHYATGRWLCLVAMWNSAGGNGDQRLFIGTQCAPLSEASAYVTQLVGSGAVGNDASANMAFANTSGGSVSLPGRLARIDFVRDRVPTVAEALMWQEKTKYQLPQGLPPFLLPRTVASYRPGLFGNVAFDESGNGNHGAVTGATVDAADLVRQPHSARIFIPRGNYQIFDSSIFTPRIFRGAA